MNDPTDNLTPLARRILKLDVEKAYERLTIRPGDGNPHALPDLRDAARAGPRALCARFVTDEHEAAAMLAGLWLWQDYLTESHELCQALDTPSGSLWHAIVHRREGDFGNSRYWYSRAARHPALPAIAAAASAVVRDHPADKQLLRLTSPDTFGPAFTELVDDVVTRRRPPSDPLHRLAVAVQQAEFRTLFEWNAASAQR
ncbi:MAG: hypothetical protein ACK4PI_01090 [Tepidisphaerales bacterium]